MNSNQQPGPGAWYSRALSLLGIQVFFFILIAWIMWSTRDANDFSGLVVIIPLFGLYFTALPTIVVSIVALVRERVNGWPIKKVVILLSIMLNTAVLVFWLLNSYSSYFIDDGVRIEPISIVVRLHLV
jgi:uncharacterized membrane protein